MLGIDKLSYQSRWRQADPMGKLVLYAVFLLAAMLSPPMYQAPLFTLAGNTALFPVGGVSHDCDITLAPTREPVVGYADRPLVVGV